MQRGLSPPIKGYRQQTCEAALSPTFSLEAQRKQPRSSPVLASRHISHTAHIMHISLWTLYGPPCGALWTHCRILQSHARIHTHTHTQLRSYLPTHIGGPQRVHGGSQSNPIQPNRTQPNQTLPYPTLPNSTQTPAAHNSQLPMSAVPHPHSPCVLLCFLLVP